MLGAGLSPKSGCDCDLIPLDCQKQEFPANF
jgi:hypothetical protein